MGVPRWFELTLLEAEDANKPADFSHLGEQMGLRIEEVVPRQSIEEWWTLAKRWKEDSHVKRGELGDTEREVLAFLERACPECMRKVPETKRAELLRGLYEKKGV